MRTTLSISDELLTAAKRRARERGQTLDTFVATALQRELSGDRTPEAACPVPVFRGGTGPRPGVDLSSNRALLEALDEGAEPDARR
ncbi:MAG TPA: CopG family transcriptional regulator [Conexibacter sp.]|nr:CopG family transcriptional regulator [Conexibacter sp.]